MISYDLLLRWLDFCEPIEQEIYDRLVDLILEMKDRKNIISEEVIVAIMENVMNICNPDLVVEMEAIVKKYYGSAEQKKASAEFGLFVENKEIFRSIDRLIGKEPNRAEIRKLFQFTYLITRISS